MGLCRRYKIDCRLNSSDNYLLDFNDTGNIDIMDIEEEMPLRQTTLLDIQNAVNELIEKILSQTGEKK